MDEPISQCGLASPVDTGDDSEPVCELERRVFSINSGICGELGPTRRRAVIAVTIRRHSEAAFETVIEAHLLGNGYVRVAGEGFDRERAIFPETVLAFIRETQPKAWAKLEALHGDRTGEQVLGDLCKWMDTHGALATLRHGFKCYGRTLHAAYFKAAHELNPELEARYAANRLGLTASSTSRHARRHPLMSH